MSLFWKIARITWRLIALFLRELPTVIAMVLKAPTILLGSAIGVLQTTAHVAGAPRRMLRAARDVVVCPRCGWVNHCLDRWRCPVCRATRTTHCWAPCDVCGTEVPCGFIRCEARGCGEAIQHPRLEGLR